MGFCHTSLKSGTATDVFAYSDHKRSSEVICEVSNMLTLVAQLSQFQL